MKYVDPMRKQARITAAKGRKFSFPDLMLFKITYEGINVAVTGCLMLIQALHECIRAARGRKHGESLLQHYKTSQAEGSALDDGC